MTVCIMVVMPRRPQLRESWGGSSTCCRKAEGERRLFLHMSGPCKCVSRCQTCPLIDLSLHGVVNELRQSGTYCSECHAHALMSAYASSLQCWSPAQHAVTAAAYGAPPLVCRFVRGIYFLLASGISGIVRCLFSRWSVASSDSACIVHIASLHVLWHNVGSAKGTAKCMSSANTALHILPWPLQATCSCSSGQAADRR